MTTPLSSVDKNDKIPNQFVTIMGKMSHNMFELHVLITTT